MTCVACTDNGHIFLAGRDGHIYEIEYSSGSGWRKRCRKLCLTTGFGNLLSRWVMPNAFKFGGVDPVVDMVVDNERHILYARTKGMKVQVFDLGENGNGPIKKIAEEKNLINPRDAQYGRRFGSRAVARGVKPSIVCMTPISTVESKRLHMVAVLSDGRRLYISTYSSAGNDSLVSGLSGLSSSSQRPSFLKVVATRLSPPSGVGGALTFGAISAAGKTQPEDISLKVESAFCSAGTLVLSDSSASAISPLFLVNKDPSMQSSLSDNFGVAARSTRSLRELVSSLSMEGRMLSVADILPLPDTAIIVQSLLLDVDAFSGLFESQEKSSGKLWARGDLYTQHILPRRRIVIFNTMGLMEVAFNRPVDILRRLFESNAQRSQIEDFFKRFGPGEAAAMCLMLAANLLYAEELLIGSTVAQRAAEAFEDSGIAGVCQLNAGTAVSGDTAQSGGFSMGQVVHEAEPVFSGAYEGLCLCASRLLSPIWESPIMLPRGDVGPSSHHEGVLVCRLTIEAMKFLESKVRSLEQFLRSRRNKRRGLYGYVAGLGDYSGSILYGTNSHLSARNLLAIQAGNAETNDGMTKNKRLRADYSSAELAAMEVRAMECVRRLLRRSSEALFLLQLICHHNVPRLVQGLDSNVRQKLINLSFNQLVCSDEGDQLAIRLIAGLMEYYIGPDGKGTVDEANEKLREGCPSYYNEADYKYFLAVEYLEKASIISNAHESEVLARDALNLLSKIPKSADLSSICKRFEDLRFYEAVVRLPLQKAQVFETTGDEPQLRDRCYEIIMDALRSLKGIRSNGIHREFSTSGRISPALDQASRDKYIRQVVQLSVQWPDTAFHEYLYRTMIDLGLEDELLEYGGPDLASFLQTAGRRALNKVQVLSVNSTAPSISNFEGANQTKYLDLLARYYVMKQQHHLAAHILHRLAERQCTNSEEAPTLGQRLQYLSNAILQAKSASSSIVSGSSNKSSADDGLLDMLEAKLTVLHFQIRIKEELELIATKLKCLPGNTESHPDDPSPEKNLMADADVAMSAKEKAKELSVDLKSITQLYNEYAVPFRLWEVCLEMLNFANYSGDADSRIVRETWARLIDEALSRGGVSKACSVVKRVGVKIYPGDGAFLPSDTLCLHLEKAALERSSWGTELVGDEDVARSLLAACKGAPEPVLDIYDKLLSNGTIAPSVNLRLRLLRSVLVVLREWVMSVVANRLGTTAVGASFIFGKGWSPELTINVDQGFRYKIESLANRYMTEVQRLPIPLSQTEPVFRGFRELEEKLEFLLPATLTISVAHETPGELFLE